MKKLDRRQCGDVVGGKRYTFAEWATLAGYLNGKLVDFAHGFWDGVMGVERH